MRGGSPFASVLSLLNREYEVECKSLQKSSSRFNAAGMQQAIGITSNDCIVLHRFFMSSLAA
jgi:hypothetical protein